MRAGLVWSDTCILNISTRGLLIQSGGALSRSDTVELWRGEHVIVARVVWRQGSRVGLKAEDLLPVEDIMTSSQEQALRLTSGRALVVERRKRSRTHDDSRARARAMEFAGIAMIASILAAGAFAMVEDALGRPLALVVSALGK